MEGVGGYNGWRWIFIIEGLIADWPETAKFLTPSEQKLLLCRLGRDKPEANMDTFDRNARRRTFSDWKIYVG